MIDKAAWDPRQYETHRRCLYRSRERAQYEVRKRLVGCRTGEATQGWICLRCKQRPGSSPHTASLTLHRIFVSVAGTVWRGMGWGGVGSGGWGGGG